MRGVAIGYRTVEVKEFEKPIPGPGEVLMQVRAAAICRADLSLYHGLSVFGAEPDTSTIAGHEPSGVVEAVGPGVGGLAPGDRIVGYLAVSCGRCRHCRAGWKMLCETWQCLGFDRHGADADYLLLPAENCLPIPESFSFVTGALSSDAIGTLYQAQHALGVNGTDTVVVVGVGPMGGGGILVAKGRGARVIAVDLLEDRLQQSLELGADATVNAGTGDALEAIRELTGGRGASVAIDCSGSPQGQNLALDCAAKLGRVALVGASDQTEIRPKQQLSRKQLTVRGSWYFNVSLYPEIVDFITERELPVDALVSDRYDLDDAKVAFERFDRRETAGKVVFTW